MMRNDRMQGPVNPHPPEPAERRFHPLPGALRLPPMAIGLLITLLAMAARLSVFVRRREFGSYATVDASALTEIICVVVTGGLLVLSNRLPKTLGRAKGGVWAFIAMMMLGVLSMFWSPMWAYSAYRAASVLSQFLAVLVLFTFCPNFLLAEKLFLRMAMAVLCLQWLAIGRSAGLTGMFSPGAMHNNTLATSSAMVCCYCLGESLTPTPDLRRRRRLRILGMIALLAVAGGTSSASNVATIAGLLAASLLVRRTDLFLILLFLGILGGLMTSHETLVSAIMPGKSEQSIATMSGRMYLWTLYLERIMEHPVIGEGYAISARIAEHYTTNAHNSILSILLGTGAVGLVFFVFSMLQAGGRLIHWTTLRIQGSVGAAAALAAGLVNSMSKGFIGEGYYPETLVFFGVFCLAALHIRPWNPIPRGVPPPLHPVPPVHG